MQRAVDIGIPLLGALAVSALLTPVVSRLARACGMVDHPSDRSVSYRPNIPLGGGLAVAAGFGAGLLLALWLSGVRPAPIHLGGMLLGGLVILALGTWDDRSGLGAAVKFTVQIAAAAIAIAAGYQMDHLTEPITRRTFIFTEPLVWLASGLWIVGVTNALNLVDGLDGLATGMGAIICATLSVVLLQTGQPFGVCVGVALLGGLLGFLPFNFPPARIFLGDAGSLFVGYTLALLALEGYRQVTVITFVVPLLALAVPIIDTLISILRRARTGRSPFRADRQHIHHQLLARRGSARATVLQFYFLTACFSLIAMSFKDLQGFVAALCLIAVLFFTLRLLWNLGVLSFSAREEPAVPDILPGREEKEP